jgi:predicted unusual protein kinase regulating ubiquinone biosynthesis (AarF/ABC1/UbiB family)
MSQDKLPTSKIERASKFLKTGVKVGSNYAKHYGQKILLNREMSREELDRKNANDIFESFAELRGSALKMAQMLSMDTFNLSTAFTDVMQKAQYSVPPMSAPMAVQAFKNSMGKSPEQVFDRFDAQAHKAASMGQVHVAWKDGKKLAVKIQYPGVADSIKSDIKLVKSIAPRIANTTAAELAPFFQEVEERLLEEADYTHELQKSIEFSERCKNVPGIVFPAYYPEMSSQRVITMEWIEGVHLKEFLASNPPKELKQKVAENLWNFYEYQMHVLRTLNADPHPGNFLFREDGSIGVLDFGCTKTLTQELYDDYFALAEPGLFADRPRVEQVMRKLQILRPSDTRERVEYLINLFERLITYIAQPYHRGYFNFANDSFYEEMTQISMEMSKMREVRGTRDFLFINRTYYGLYALFRELGAELNTTCQYRDFLIKTNAQA